MGSPHSESAPHQVLGAIGLVNVEIQRFSPNHVIDVSRDFVGGCSLVLSHKLAKFVSIGLVKVEI